MNAHDLIDVEVRSLTPAGERVLLIELARADAGAGLPPYDAGSHIDIHVGDFVRQYSLVGSDEGADTYLIAVLREREGRGGSATIHDTLQLGDRVQISAPRNTFPLDLDAQHSVLVAGGIGLTPLVSMAERLHREGKSFDLHVYSAAPETLPLGDYLATRPWSDRVIRHHSSHGDSFRGKAPAVIGRPAPGTAVYLCGPLGMVASATGYASAAEWPKGAIHVERFERAEPIDTGGDAFTVIAASSGLQMEIGEDETIASVLERNGFEVFLSCEQGICGSCLTGVVEGLPDHRDEVQTPAEHELNTQINVCCSRALTPALVLDI